MGRRLAPLAALVFSLAVPAAALGAEAEGIKERGEASRTPLERAKEESGARGGLRSALPVPGGELRVTPTELVAGSSGQRIRLTVELQRRVKDESLIVTLPARWLDRTDSGLRPVRRPRLDATGADASIDTNSRGMELTVESGSDGDRAAIEFTDVGIPAGTWSLPLEWRDARGRVKTAGTAKLRFYAPVREGEPGNPWDHLRVPRIEENVTSDTKEESESFIAVTPGNPSRIAVAVNDASLGATTMSAWVTNDGGANWALRPMPSTMDVPGSTVDSPGRVIGDPILAADDQGTMWVGALVRDPDDTDTTVGPLPGPVVVNRIAAGGTALQTVNTSLPVVGSSQQDKPMMTVDNSPTSPTYGRLYVVWNEPQNDGSIDVVISQCDTRSPAGYTPENCDVSENWSTPTDVTAAETGGQGGSFIYADAAVHPDGRVFVTWWDFSSRNAIRGDVCNPSSQSCESAAAWGNPGAADKGATTVATLDSTGSKPVPFACPIIAQPGGRAAPSPQVDVDRSGGANNGRVYVTWGDLRAGSGSTRCAEDAFGVGTPPLATHLTWDSFVASRADALPGGSTPSTSAGTRLYSDGEENAVSNSDEWFPWLSVDQTSGQAYGNFYSTRDDSTRRTTRQYLRAVTPSGSGHSLGAPTRVSSGASNYSTRPCCGFGNDYGDYEGQDSTSGAVFPVWTDNSGGDGEAFTQLPSVSFVHRSVSVTEDAGADGDGFVEGGEPVTLSEVVTNSGTTGVTGVGSTLTSESGGATVTQGSSAYPDLVATAFAANQAPFRATLPAGAPCGTPLAFRTDLSGQRTDNGQATSGTVNFSIQTTCAPPPPPPPPVAPPPPPPPPPVTPLTLRLSVSTASRRSFDTAFFSGIRASARCNRDCKLDARVLLDSRTAKKLRLKRQLARRRGSLTRAGIKRLVMKLSTRTQKKLSTLKSVKLSLRVVGTTADAQRRTVTKRITLKR